MITRKLLAALVGLSLAAGTLGAASAQTAGSATAPSASPSDATVPSTAAKSDVTKKAPLRHHARMTSKTHRKHVSLRAAHRVATAHVARQHVAGRKTVIKTAAHAGKRIRLSHLAKRSTSKHV